MLNKTLKPFYLIVISIFFCSCSSLQTQYAKELSEMLDEVAEITDNTLKESSDWTRELEIEKTAADDEILKPNLLIDTGEDYVWTFRKGFSPLYVQIRTNAKALRILNTEISLYFKILSILEKNDSGISEKDFNKIYQSVKAANSEIAKFASIPSLNYYNGLISTSIASLVNQYLKTKKQKIFNEIIAQNQKNIEDWEKIYIETLRATAINIKTTYTETALKILTEDSKTKGARKKQVETIFNLNDKVTTSLDKLAEIEKAVRKVPQIHAKLSDKNAEVQKLLAELQIIIFNLEALSAIQKR